MVYLDYSATTPVRQEVLDSFVMVCKNYIGNSNSLHLLGSKSRHLMEEAEKAILSLLQTKNSEIVFTSGATEANNLAILGVIEAYPKRGKHILTTPLEHSSVSETLRYLKTKGYEVEEVPLDDNGQVDLDCFRKMLRPDTVLVTMASVSSEVGILQPISKMGAILRDYPTTLFHVDGTQQVGKVPVCLDDIDLFSFSAHKIYGIQGIGALIKKKNVNLCPQLHGGKSQSKYRSGTPSLALMVSFAKALRLVLEEMHANCEKIQTLHDLLVFELAKIEGVVFNSTEKSIPHIVNISIPGIKAEVLLHALEQDEIYVSTKTACSKNDAASPAVLALGKDQQTASSSIRISLSYLTTEEEIKKFLKVFALCVKKLNFRKS